MLSTYARAEVPEDKLKSLSSSSLWQKIYFYEAKSVNSWQSEVVNKEYFFSEHGPINPYEELKEAIAAFTNSKPSGISQKPAQCVFPFRKKIIEQSLGLKFPEVKCDDYQEWKRKLPRSKISIVYAGPYAGNPASILGHTFLKLSTDEKSKSDLLSYSVAYLAQTPQNENGMAYAYNGIVGNYLANYEIKPYYVNVGVYNNAESRDLWSYELNLTEAERENLVDYLWEVRFNADFKYYFFTKNCSYRILNLVEVARHKSNLSSAAGVFVLPLDTIRQLEDNKYLSETRDYRSSIQKRILRKIARLNKEQKGKYIQARSAQGSALLPQDASVLDILIEEWNFKNYDKKLNLTEAESKYVDALHSQRSKVMGEPFDERPVDLESMKERGTPLDSHRTSWYGFYGGTNEQSKPSFAGEIYMGAHKLGQNPKGMDGSSEVKYGGVEWVVPHKTLNFNIASVYNLEPSRRFFPAWSWKIKGTYEVFCKECYEEASAPVLEVGAGVTQSLGLHSYAFVLLEAVTSYWHTKSHRGYLSPGIELGWQFSYTKWTWGARGHLRYPNAYFSTKYESTLNYQLDTNLSLVLRAEHQELRKVREESLYALGLERHF